MELNRRYFLKRLAGTGLGIGAAASVPSLSSHVWGAPAVDKPLRVCLLSGSKEYQSNESLASFQELLERDYPIKCSRAFWTSKNNLPGLEALESCDVMVLFTKRLELPADQLKRVKKYCLSGRPIVGLRTASHAFQNWLELDREVFGGSYSGHFGDGLTTKVTVADDASRHPILKGFTSFETPTKLYKNPSLADDTHLLLTGAIPGHTEPLAWTREYRGGRVFYTSLGGPDDFEINAFRTMLVNALFWTSQQEKLQ